MTVKDLIKDLQQYPDDADISLQDTNKTALSIHSYNLTKKPDAPGETLEIHFIAVAATRPETSSEVNPEENDDISM